MHIPAPDWVRFAAVALAHGTDRAATGTALRGVSSMVEQRTFNPASLSAVLTCESADKHRPQEAKSDALNS